MSKSLRQLFLSMMSYHQFWIPSNSGKCNEHKANCGSLSLKPEQEAEKSWIVAKKRETLCSFDLKAGPRPPWQFWLSWRELRFGAAQSDGLSTKPRNRNRRPRRSERRTVRPAGLEMKTKSRRGNVIDLTDGRAVLT